MHAAAVPTLLTDAYQVSMMFTHWKAGTHRKLVAFDLYFRKAPFAGSFAVANGINSSIEYLTNFHFSADDLAYIAETFDFGADTAEYIEHLRTFRFTGTVMGAREGTVVFANEPIVTIIAPVEEAQYFETPLLTMINHQTLIATKASRCVWAAQGDSLFEAGLRRAQGGDAGIYGARAAYIAGFDVIANMEAGRRFGIPVSGTHAHALVQFFGTEYEAFKAWASAFPNNMSFLVDTYDVLRSGMPNAIRVAKEAGKPLASIRIDSGKLLYLSTECRRMLDEAGFTGTKIVASGDLDEYKIAELKMQRAAVDTWMVGTALITADDQPALGGVYKLMAVYNKHDEVWEPRIKVSESREKTTIPGLKRPIRFVSRDTGKLVADELRLENESMPPADQTHRLFDPNQPWLENYIRDFRIEPLHVCHISDGLVSGEIDYSTKGAREQCKAQLGALWPDFRSLHNPEPYRVNLSEGLWGLQQRMLVGARQQDTVSPSGK